MLQNAMSLMQSPHASDRASEHATKQVSMRQNKSKYLIAIQTTTSCRVKTLNLSSCEATISLKAMHVM